MAQMMQVIRQYTSGSTRTIAERIQDDSHKLGMRVTHMTSFSGSLCDYVVVVFESCD